MRCGEGHNASTVLCGSCNASHVSARCSRGYALQSDGTCACCASPTVVWLALLAALGAMGWVIRTSVRAALAVGNADELSRVMATLAKIGVNYAQMTSLLSGFGLDWGSSLRLAFSAMGVAGGAVAQAISLPCLVDLSYASRARIGLVVVPLAIALGPGVVLYGLDCRARLRPHRRRAAEPRDERARRWSASSLVLVWLLYPTIAHEAFRVVRCVNVEGRLWLRAELQTECAGAEYDAVRTLALAAIALFVLGVPLALFVGMRRRRDAIRAGAAEGDGALAERARLYKFLFSPYSPRFFWWETSIMLRKAALVAVLAFVPAEQGDLRVFIGLGVLQIPLLLQLKHRPYRTAVQNRWRSCRFSRPSSRSSSALRSPSRSCSSPRRHRRRARPRTTAASRRTSRSPW